MPGFAAYHEADIRIGAGATIERTAVLKLAGLAESVVVEGAGSRVEARGSGVETRFGMESLRTIPTRRASMFDSIRAAPGVSPTSPSSGTSTTISAFGSGANENQFLIDGTNFTCPCNGVRAIGAGRRLHSGSSSPVGRRVRRVRQRSGRGDQRRHQAGQRAVSVGHIVLRSGGGLDQPAGAASRSRRQQPAKRLRRARYRDFDGEPRRSGRS